MNTSHNPLARLISRNSASLILSAALLCAVVPVQGAPATDAPTLHSAADKAPKLPLTPSFAKEMSGENKGLYTLTLKNVSQHSLKTGGAVQQSVVTHSRPKNYPLESQAIEPGKTRKIEGLAAQDKVTITADGFEPLELTVP